MAKSAREHIGDCERVINKTKGTFKECDEMSSKVGKQKIK